MAFLWFTISIKYSFYVYNLMSFPWGNFSTNLCNLQNPVTWQSMPQLRSQEWTISQWQSIWLLLICLSAIFHHIFSISNISSYENQDLERDFSELLFHVLIRACLKLQRMQLPWNMFHSWCRKTEYKIDE